MCGPYGGMQWSIKLFYVEMCLFVESVLSCVGALPHVEKGVGGGCCTTGREVLYSGLLSAGK